MPFLRTIRASGASTSPPPFRNDGRADGYVWHNTRHSAVTNLTNAGVLRHEAKTASGHTTDEVFNRYSIGTEQPQRAALGTGTLYTEQFEADRLSFPSPTAPTLPIRRPESSPE